MSRIATGTKFGKLTIIGKDTVRSSPGRLYVNVRCDCGVEKSVRADGLTSGAVVTCGCGKKYHGLKHGYNKKSGRSSEYCSWDSMVQRCTNPRHPVYGDYGGRGITICERWLSFENFIADMGPKPEISLSIERKDNQLGYSPENCIWATQSEQMRNTRRTVKLTILGVTKCLGDWAREAGIDRRTILSRLKKGWDEHSAIFTPTTRRAA